MAKITMETLEEILKKYNIENNYNNFIFGYKLSKLTGFADMQIFGTGKNCIVMLPVTVLGALEDKNPVVLKIFDEIDGFELKKGLLSHTLIINFSDGKKLKYKINKYVIPYPWHNESVKRLINNGE
ncbi:hypothetical protein [Sebaldella sp. S0638]|uniref:hypothetical protein n=1 Tax=Sebaldella sp. S0638 TaxID=2957809 RepID=UPI00209EDFE8|nr:hypothetical protein [Sebaldella sp. S0638]MCP1224548.1 hypothetical protein [Sebaldella sp. S0638]